MTITEAEVATIASKIPQCPECGTKRWILKETGFMGQIVVADGNEGRVTWNSDDRYLDDNIEVVYACENGHDPSDSEFWDEGPDDQTMALMDQLDEAFTNARRVPLRTIISLQDWTVWEGMPA